MDNTYIGEQIRVSTRHTNNLKKWLNTTITRRDAIVATAKVGAAVTLS